MSVWSFHIYHFNSAWSSAWSSTRIQSTLDGNWSTWRAEFGHESSSCREWDKKVIFVVKLMSLNHNNWLDIFVFGFFPSSQKITSLHAGFHQRIYIFLMVHLFRSNSMGTANFKLLCDFDWYATWNFFIVICIWAFRKFIKNQNCLLLSHCPRAQNENKLSVSFESHWPTLDE